MARYIDVESLGIGRANSEVFENRAYAEGWNSAIDIVFSAPTADVQEVKHAKWVHYGEDIQCSNCLHVSDDICFEGDMDSGYDTVLPHYCSNCGAKMDLEENENEH